MNLARVRDILVNFTQKDWKKEEFESALHFAQMKYFIMADERGDNLFQFKVNKGDGTPPLYVMAGETAVPSDFFKLVDEQSSMNVPADGNRFPVRVCEEGLFDYLYNSPVEYPTIEYPIAKFVGSVIRLEPKTIQYVNITYYAYPVIPVFGVTTIRGFEEYDPLASVELNWAEDEVVFIIQIVLQDLGIIASVEQIKEKAK